MKTTISRHEFRDAFRACGREDNFSYEALALLFDYLEQYEDDTGEELELDVIAICCEYTEDTAEEIASNYSIDLTDCEDEDDRAEAVRDYLNDNTQLVGETSTGFVYLAF